MKPGETIRYTCDECLTVFGLSLAPVAEWPETMGHHGRRYQHGTDVHDVLPVLRSERKQSARHSQGRRSRIGESEESEEALPPSSRWQGQLKVECMNSRDGRIWR